MHDLDELEEWEELDAAKRKRKFKIRLDPFDYYCEDEFTQRQRSVEENFSPFAEF